MLAPADSLLFEDGEGGQVTTHELDTEVVKSNYARDQSRRLSAMYTQLMSGETMSPTSMHEVHTLSHEVFQGGERPAVPPPPPPRATKGKQQRGTGSEPAGARARGPGAGAGGASRRGSRTTSNRTFLRAAAAKPHRAAML